MKSAEDVENRGFDDFTSVNQYQLDLFDYTDQYDIANAISDN